MKKQQKEKTITQVTTTKEGFLEKLKRKGIVKFEIVGDFLGSTKQATFKCLDCGYEFDSKKAEYVLQGKKCPECLKKQLKTQRNTKKTTEEFKQELLEKLGSEYELLSEYESVKKPVKILHKLCGEIWEPIASKALIQNCPICAKTKRIKNTTYTKDEFFRKLKEKNEDWELVSDYKGTDKKIILKHVCGEIMETEPKRIIRGLKCKACEKLEKNPQLYKTLFEEKHGKEWELVTNYIHSKKKVTIKNKKCGHLKQLVASDLYTKTKIHCEFCERATILTEEIVKERLKKIEKIEIKNINLKQSEIEIKFNCCGYTNTFELKNFLRRKDQELCANCQETSISKKEKEVAVFVEENYKKEIITSTRQIIKPLELDIYLPDLKLAFEFNGIYWHSGELKTNDYHVKKTELCEAQGIQLIHILESDWEQKQEIVKSKILNLLSLTPTKVFARSCKIQKLENKQKNEFLEANHIQGTCVSSINYGLFQNEDLVAVMTFSKLRNGMSSKTETATHELIRFATKVNTTVTGGFSKLLKNICLLHPEIEEIKTFALRDWSKGNVYERNGFVFSHNSKPNYFYIKRNTKYSRVDFQKHKLKDKLTNFDPTKTEIENVLADGFRIFYDSGNKVYKKKVCANREGLEKE